MKLRLVAMTGVLSLAGLGLIGVGAHAVFTTSTTSNQTVSAGTLSVVLNSPEAVGGWNTDNLTLAPITGAASTFTGGDETVTATNIGSLNAYELVFTVSSTYPTSALAKELSVCISSTGLGTGGSVYAWYNGPVANLPAGGWGQQGDYLTVGGPYSAPGVTPAYGPTDNYNVQFYAGAGQTTACGTSPVGWPDLQNDAMGESIVISSTMTYQDQP
jgi:hypothetical protein